MTEPFKVGDVIEVTFLNNAIAVIVRVNDDGRSYDANWIAGAEKRLYYNHRAPACDIWLSSYFDKEYKKITHIEVPDDTTQT